MSVEYWNSSLPVVKIGDFEFDVNLLISLVDVRPVLWDKTDDIYKDRNETKKAWREVCICLQEDFEALWDDKKTILLNIAIIYWTQLIAIQTNLCFFILCTLLFIFFTSARKQLQHPERVNEALRCHIGAQSNGRLTGNMVKRRSTLGDHCLRVWI